MSIPANADAVRIVEFAATSVAAMEYQGDAALLDDAVPRFVAWRREQHLHLHPHRHATFNILYDVPANVTSGHIRFDFCVAYDKDVAPNPAGIVRKWIAGGRYAVLRHPGNDALLGAAIHWLRTEWLAQSGERLRDGPMFMQRVQFAPFVPADESITDIYLPLR